MDIHLEFLTPNTRIKVLHVLKSKDDKIMVVKKEIFELVYKVCNPKDITFDNLERVVLSCMI
jgi:hypothetical protein